MSFPEIFKEEEKGGTISGVMPGIVTNNEDPEGMGRVKLSFPWRFAEDESDWVRVAAPMAGKERGMFFLPEVEDEVLVAFEMGDIHHPYVIGSLWNGKDTPPETNSDGKNNVRMIRSRSGHKITFNDDDSGKKEQIEIKTNAGHTILLDDSSGGEKIEIKDKTGSNTIIIDSVSNSISFESSTELTIKSKTINIESDGEMTVKAGATLNLKGMTVKIN
ncbi:MAG: phage baseplate assembly protein V [ANME-2 cluster archaeon]|nr:phage baseplate assembly protein V [ANME-2 cluster archaeon]